MTEAQQIEIPRNTNKGQTLLVGGLLGAITGVGVAYLLIKRSEQQGGELNMSTGEGIRLGLLVMGLLRQVADLAVPESKE